MSSKITINGYSLCKTKICATEYKVSVFQNYMFDFQFNVLLQPKGEDDVLPTYQLSAKSLRIPEWTKKNLNLISDWITNEAK